LSAAATGPAGGCSLTAAVCAGLLAARAVRASLVSHSRSPFGVETGVGFAAGSKGATFHETKVAHPDSPDEPGWACRAAPLFARRSAGVSADVIALLADLIGLVADVHGVVAADDAGQSAAAGRVDGDLRTGDADGSVDVVAVVVAAVVPAAVWTVAHGEVLLSRVRRRMASVVLAGPEGACRYWSLRDARAGVLGHVRFPARRKRRRANKARRAGEGCGLPTLTRAPERTAVAGQAVFHFRQLHAELAHGSVAVLLLNSEQELRSRGGCYSDGSTRVAWRLVQHYCSKCFTRDLSRDLCVISTI
jgi:hypothetical protein